MTTRRRIVLAAIAAVTVGALAACSASTSRGSSDDLAAGGGQASGANSEAAGAPAVPSAAPAPGAPGGSGAVDLSDPRALIQTAELTVRVKHGVNINPVADRAAAVVTAAGGLVFTDQRSTGREPTADQTFKVPPSALTTVLSQLAGLGKQVFRQLSTRDVTATVADVTSRVQSATLAIRSLDALYRRATKLGDVIRLEDELSQREANLESLQAQQRALDSETSLATVTLTLETAPKKAVKHHHAAASHGIGTGFRNGWHAFATAVTWTAAALAAALPFLVVIAVILLGTVFGWRRLRTTPPPAAATDPTTHPAA